MPKTQGKASPKKATATFMNPKTSKKVKAEVASKESYGVFRPEFIVCPVDKKLVYARVAQEEYDQLDVPETCNQRADYLARLEKCRKEGRDKLPANWKSMTPEEQCAVVDKLINDILQIDNDFDLSVRLSFRNCATASVQFASDGLIGDQGGSALCHLVRRNPDITLADLPEAFQKWAAKEYYEDAEKASRDVSLEEIGKTFTEALENLFNLILLLFHGYDFVCLPDDYRVFLKEYYDEDEEDEGEDAVLRFEAAAAKFFEEHYDKDDDESKDDI